MMFQHLLFAVTGLATLPYVLAAAIPDANDAQNGMSVNNMSIEQLIRRSNCIHLARLR